MSYRDNCGVCYESYDSDNLQDCRFCGRGFCYACGSGLGICKRCLDSNPAAQLEAANAAVRMPKCLPSGTFGNVRVVAVSGRIDNLNWVEFSLALAPHAEAAKTGKEILVLDFSNVEYCNIFGWHEVTTASKKHGDGTNGFAVAARKAQVIADFKMINFEKYMTFYDSVRDVIAARAPQALDAYLAAQR